MWGLREGGKEVKLPEDRFGRVDRCFHMKCSNVPVSGRASQRLGRCALSRLSPTIEEEPLSGRTGETGDQQASSCRLLTQGRKDSTGDAKVEGHRINGTHETKELESQMR